MLKFEITKKNKTVYVDDVQELVTWLRKTDIKRWKDNQDFMNNYSIVYPNAVDKKIDCSNEAEFVESLIEIGEIKPVENKKYWNFLKFKSIN